MLAGSVNCGKWRRNARQADGSAPPATELALWEINFRAAEC
jgi:hypothetical protein